MFANISPSLWQFEYLGTNMASQTRVMCSYLRIS